MKRIKNLLIMIILATISISAASGAEDSQPGGGCEACHPDIVRNYTTSLHYTDAGRIYVNLHGGCEAFGIDVPESCSTNKCHAPTNCNVGCHEGYGVYPEGHGKMVAMDICVDCHLKRSGGGYKGLVYMHGESKKGPHPDIHYEKGLECMDCHPSSDIHGDGQTYKSQWLAVNATCEDCHKNPGKIVKGMNVTQFSTGINAHRIHEGKLDCTACHLGWYQSCINCHLDTHKTDGTTTENFHLGVGYNGKIRPFYRQMTSYGNETYTTFGEFAPHTITDKPHDCAFCHENKEVLCEGCEGEILGPGSFIPQETIDHVLGIAPAPAKTPAATPAESTPGFTVCIAITGMLAAAYLLRRR